ncbi:MAG: LptA/OstA family protein [Vulcanimicrobiaceae bacterium]
MTCARAGLAVAALLALIAAAPQSPSPSPTASPSPVPSASGSPAARGATAQVAEWTIQSDEVDTNIKSGDFSSPHHLLLTRADGSTIEADRGTGNYKKRFFQLYGKVAIHDQSGSFGGLSSAQQNVHGPATLTCDELQVDSASKVYHAIGSVHYIQQNTTADADDARLNDKTHQLDLQGKVHLVQGARTLDAARATYNTFSQDGEAGGDVRMIFPGAITPSIATPKPIKVPKIPQIPQVP